MGGKRSGPDWTLILSFAVNIVLIFLIQNKIGPANINQHQGQGFAINRSENFFLVWDCLKGLMTICKLAEDLCQTFVWFAFLVLMYSLLNLN